MAALFPARSEISYRFWFDSLICLAPGKRERGLHVVYIRFSSISWI